MAKDNVETNEFGVAAPDGQLKRLAPLVGKWHTDFETKDSIYGPGARGTSDEEFYWLDGGYFLVQTYRTVFGSEPAQTGINYWYYDPDKKRFGIIFFSNNGNFTEDGSRYFGGVEGDKLTMIGPAKFQYNLDKDGNIAANADGTVTVSWWLQDEKGEYQPWMENTFSQL
jgi:Protein of unknown function (DUF1579)